MGTMAAVLRNKPCETVIVIILLCSISSRCRIKWCGFIYIFRGQGVTIGEEGARWAEGGAEAHEASDEPGVGREPLPSAGSCQDEGRQGTGKVLQRFLPSQVSPPIKPPSPWREVHGEGHECAPQHRGLPPYRMVPPAPPQMSNLLW